MQRQFSIGLWIGNTGAIKNYPLEYLGEWYRQKNNIIINPKKSNDKKIEEYGDYGKNKI